MQRRMIWVVIAVMASIFGSSAVLAGDSSGVPWPPKPGLRWQIQYKLPLALSIDADVYILDMFDTDAKVLATLRARGKRAVCYINAGAWEDWRDDKATFPPEVLGNVMTGYPNERWLDTRSPTVLALMERRLDLCRQKGFDGVIFDNVNSHTHATGFPLTPTNSLDYNARLANAGRTRGLAVGMNNNSLQTKTLEPYFDWALAESCFEQGWCANFSPFVKNGKAVVAIEYNIPSERRPAVCKQAEALGFYVMFKGRDLGAYRQDCYDKM